ncbi:MAG: hypothetical protein KDC87_13415 [Planctomycetes bacterium]|nr:hypothetical protein [Planctomycetota bacterium]MCB9872048.1 hypothetical protein [Planctomycetota bacterium]MCB9888449.1 hypothetical protein [Planctomycetota bacterium]
MLTRTAMSLGVLCVFAPAPQSPSTHTAADAAYARIMARATQAVQSELEGSTRIWDDHSTWDKAWEIESKHFRIRTTQPWAYGTKLGDGLDQMVAIMQQHGLELNLNGSAKGRVLLYPSIEEYNKHGNSNNADEHSTLYGSYFGARESERPVVGVVNPSGTLVWMQITHSVTHQLLHRAYPGQTRPPWIEEGLASYFALHWNWPWGAEELRRFQKEGNWVPVYNLLRRPVSRYGTQAHQYWIELGMLFSYLINYRADTKCTKDANGNKTGPFLDYLRDALAGKNVATHPLHAKLFEDTKVLEDGFKSNKW